MDVGVKSTAVVDDAQLDDDHLAAGDVVSAAAVGVTQLVEDALAAVDVDIAVDDVQVFEAIDPADDDLFSSRRQCQRESTSLGRVPKGVATASPVGLLIPLHLSIQLHLLRWKDPLPLLLSPLKE